MHLFTILENSLLSTVQDVVLFNDISKVTLSSSVFSHDYVKRYLMYPRIFLKAILPITSMFLFGLKLTQIIKGHERNDTGMLNILVTKSFQNSN